MRATGGVVRFWRPADCGPAGLLARLPKGDHGLKARIGPVGALALLLGAISLPAQSPPLRAAEVDPVAMAARIDEHLEARQQAEGLLPAPLSDDATFLRRLSLDLTGIIPSVHDVRGFLADSRPDKRSRWIEELLSRPRHASHLATTWRRALVPEGANPVFGGSLPFEAWLRTKFSERTPYDQLVTELLLATGSPGQNGPAYFYTSLQFKPEELAASTSRIFLGVQIQCAQCHNHPFDTWTKESFWGYAAFFARLQQPTNPQQAFTQQVVENASGELKLPGTEQVVAPRFLTGEAPSTEVSNSRRTQLALWMTARQNPYFAKAAVNRAWAMMFGRGLVEPLDDLGPHNKASHPELLDELSAWFVDSGFDLPALWAALANSRGYQRASQSENAALDRPELFVRMQEKSLSAEQLYDCLIEAIRRREDAANQQLATLARGANDPGRQSFIARFQAPTQGSGEYQSGIPQALTLMNGGLISGATDLAASDLLVALEAPFFTDEERVEALFLSTLSRPPRDDERSPLVDYVRSGGPRQDRRRALGDVLWALLNSGEFALNH